VTVAQVAGGHTDLGVVAMGSGKSMIDGGLVRYLAALGEQRAAAPYDKVPTVKELGYDVAVYSSHLALGPPKMPKEISEKLLSVFQIAANDPEFKAFVIQNNGIPSYMLPEQTTKWFDDQRTIFREIMGKAGILKEK
jgi:tripartite-type tricarboxylate transporter receptor subunit TctC